MSILYFDIINQTGPSSTVSTIYTSGGVGNNIEIGQGNLKLLYSADEGKLTQYVNSNNKVFSVVTAFITVLIY